jgi:ribosomal protein S18 acetylase RimI-like enzyme
MELDEEKIDRAVLALLYLGLHGGGRAWKGFDWDALNRLHEKGYISDPVGKASLWRLPTRAFWRLAGCSNNYSGQTVDSRRFAAGPIAGRSRRSASSELLPAVIRLRPGDAERYARLRLRMLTLAPWAFGATPEDDEALDVVHLAAMMAQEHHAAFAIEARSLDPDCQTERESADHPVLVASASLTRAKGPKFAHRARIWGVFVEPEYRDRGFGKALMHAVIAHARSWPGLAFLDLSVSANSPEAQRLYESAGFAVWGREPEVTQHDGRRYDEIHMPLRLRA